MSQRGQEETLFGHPVGLFTLFFAEMWERFSFYGMRSLLVLYMTKGFLGLEDGAAYGVYGSYGALVYATPFLGGILADRYLGCRHAVILGGALMAAGHLLMGVESAAPFYMALGLLIVGNGFFKPNISTMVGSLYPAASTRRDAGFTLFYMGINLGAAISPLLCGYIGEKYGWHYGFGLATIGMLIGLCIFIFPPWLNMLTIGAGALAVAGGLFYIAHTPVTYFVNGLIACAALVSATVAILALKRGGLPDWAGRQPEAAKAKGMTPVLAIYGGTAVVVPIAYYLLQNEHTAHLVLNVLGGIALAWLLFQIATREKVQRERLQVVLVLLFFSMLFWAFFEQAGSSLTAFTDRNVDRVTEERVIVASDVGKTIDIELTQAQLGYPIPGYEILTLDELDQHRDRKKKLRESNPQAANVPDVQLVVTEKHVGMEVGGSEIPASQLQSANATFILLFGLLFSGLWTVLAKKNVEPSIPVKFGLGLMQLGAGFYAFYQGAKLAGPDGFVWMGWLLLGYLLHTTGELCISPVGLSMVTKLAPKEIVSAIMGAWFLATAFSHLLAAQIAKLTGVKQGTDVTPTVVELAQSTFDKLKFVLEGGFIDGKIPPPSGTLLQYAEVFYYIGAAAVGGGIICVIISPLLVRWTHTGVSAVDD